MPIDLTSRLSPAVAGFGYAEFSLVSDLERLEAVVEVQAIEGEIFYCARIMEALAVRAVEAMGLRASANQTSNLQILQDYNLMRRTTVYLAHGLRRLGNQARHLQRRLHENEAEYALLALERGLRWFFTDFRFGPRLPDLTRGGEPLAWPIPAELRSIVERYSDVELVAAPPTQLDGEELASLARQPALAALVAELLLDCKAGTAATAVLARALAAAPGDLRLGQLEALRRSHAEDLEGAIDILKPLLNRYGDDETTGILAGAYKRQWQTDADNLGALKTAQRLYFSGWERSRRSNPYLGINAASLLLWLGRPAESRTLAGEVRDMLMARLRVLSGPGHAGDLDLNCWDRLTLAEAQLLDGDLAGAAGAYAECFQRHARYSANLEVASDQADLVLGRLGLGCSLADLIRRERRPGPSGRGIVVGVTGHRSLSDTPELASAVSRALARVAPESREGPAPLTILSPLTEGADRLAAVVGLEREGARLHAVLPLELQDYLDDFASAESRQEFLALLSRASRVTYPPAGARRSAGGVRTEISVAFGVADAPTGGGQAAEGALAERQAAYEACGRHVVDHSDALLAVWDGEPSAGRGGTGDIVAYARARQRPLIWVQANPPHELKVERLESIGRGPVSSPGEAAGV